MEILLIFLLVIAVLLVMFVLQNATSIIVHFGVWEIESSLAIVLLYCIIAGAVLAILCSIPAILRRKKKLGELKRKLAYYEEDALRNSKKESLRKSTQKDLVLEN